MATRVPAERICDAGMMAGRPKPGWRDGKGSNGWGMRTALSCGWQFQTPPDASSCLGWPPADKPLRHQNNQLINPAVGHSV